LPKPRRKTRTALSCESNAVLAAVGLLLVVNAQANPPPVEFAYIPASDVQSGGPEYDFRISRYEVRNDEFVAFLNDAMANPGNPRGQYLYFDLDSGNVHVHSQIVGLSGTSGSGPLLFDAAINGRISLVGGQYVITDPAFAAHPVTAVTWYGALKFCNWLTLVNGLEESERAYAESPASQLSGWRPITISSSQWAVRDLTAVERDALLDKRGFRLPMDGGEDGAGAFNEWFKAASARRDASNTIVFDSLYGFGRDETPTPADANYVASDDPFEPGTAPVGFYNGINLLLDGTLTRDTDNAYGLYDLSGNAWEWLQDQSPGDSTRCRNRGGSWQSATASLKLIPGSNRPASSASSSTGFRVVQSVREVILVTPQAAFVAAGPWGGPYVPPLADPVVYRLSNLVNEQIEFTAVSLEHWVRVTPTSGSIAAGAIAEVRVSLVPECSDLLHSGEKLITLRVSFGPESTIVERTIRLNLAEPLTLTPATSFGAEMQFGTMPAPLGRNYLFNNTSDLPVEWSVSWEDVSDRSSNIEWLTINDGLNAAGTTLPHESTELSIAIDPSAAASLPAGVHRADVTFRDECTGGEFLRRVTLNVTAPVTVTPTLDSVSTGVFGGPFRPSSHVFTMINVTELPLEWAATLCVEAEPCTPPPQPWLELDFTAGTLAADEQTEIVATFTSAAQSLPIGRHSLLVRFSTGGFTADRLVKVHVTGLMLDPRDDREIRGPLGGPFVPDSLLYKLRNSGLEEMFWTATVAYASPTSLNWLDVIPSNGTLLDPAESADIVVSPSPDAAALPAGTHFAVIHFDANGATATRRIRMTVSSDVFSVRPLAGFETAGQSADTIAPAYAVYRLQNTGGKSAGVIDWRASSDQPWVMVNGHQTASGTIPSAGRSNLLVTIDSATAPQLPPGITEQEFEAVLTIEDLTHAETITRDVSLTLVVPRFHPNESLVSATHSQPAGPNYPFRMGKFHVTNQEFVIFLNDAIARRHHQRSAYMYFHSPTGDVFLNANAIGQVGEVPGTLNTRLFLPAASGQIRFANGQYEIIAAKDDYSLHPVTGVSWFGAAKFCNWLTLDHGMLPGERCYIESGDPTAWRPVSISAADWLTRDLSDEERLNLVNDCRGFRLPMDDGYNNPTSTTDAADGFNEWYKSAAWNDALHLNTLFGFGRGTLSGADANFRCSGDGFEDIVNCMSGGSTPVGYYDGTVKAGSFATGPNDNSFGLFDMTGNVHQWLQDRFAPPTTIDRRTLRGGSWNDPASSSSLRSTSRTMFASPATASNQIGFRILRTLAPSNADYDGDGNIDLFDFASLLSCATGPGVSPSAICVGFDFDRDADVDLRDISAFLNLLTIASNE